MNDVTNLIQKQIGEAGAKAEFERFQEQMDERAGAMGAILHRAGWRVEEPLELVGVCATTVDMIARSMVGRKEMPAHIARVRQITAGFSRVFETERATPLEAIHALATVLLSSVHLVHQEGLREDAE